MLKAFAHKVTQKLDRLLDVTEGRLHPEWRLITCVSVFCGAAALSTHFWEVDQRISMWVMIVAFVLSLLFLAFIKFKNIKSFPIILTILFLSGLFVGQLRVVSLQNEFVISKPYVDVTAVVERLEEKESGLIKLLVNPITFGQNTTILPARIRVLVRTDVAANIRTGSVVSFSAKLNVPGGPVVPQGYDFAKASFFKGIGVEAIAVSPVLMTGTVYSQKPYKNYWVLQLREQIETRILDKMSGQAGAVAVALTVGFRNHLTNDTTEALRRAGLSHLLAISGLHVGLVTAACFFLFEILFAAVPAIALRIMPKKLAVAPTWIVAFIYLLLSGASTSTIRAFIMVSVALLAIVADRKVLSLRSVALAAFFITLWRPESVTTIGFQMSFAATAGLVVFYGKLGPYLRVGEGKDTYKYHRFLTYFLGIAVTSLVAQAAVAPFSLYHFQSLSIVGVIANVLALPVMAFAVMPLLFIGILTSPAGGITIVSGVVGYCLDFILGVSAKVAALPYAVLYVSPVSSVLFACAVGCFLLLLVYHSKYVWGAFGIVMLGFWGGSPNKDGAMLISRTGKMVSVFYNDQIYSKGGRRGSFREKAWNQYWGKGPNEPHIPISRICDVNSCGYDIHGNQSFALQYVKNMGAVKRICVAGSIVIIPDRYKRYCKGARAIFTERELELYGPAALSFGSENSVSVKWSQSKREAP